MPKPRVGRAAAGPSSYFEVSPWHDKASGAAEQHAEEPREERYSEVEMPLVVGGGTVGGSSGGAGIAAAAAAAAHGAAPEAMAVDVEAAVEPAAVAPPALPSPPAPAVAAALAAPPAGGGGWVSKKRKPAGEDDTLPAGGYDFSASMAGTGGAGGAAAAAEQQQEGQQGAELEGTAYLALLPNGSITGHLLCAPSALTGGGRRRSFGIMAELVVAGRECTRDADWGVLRMTLVSFGPTAASAGEGATGGSGGGQGAGGAAAAREVSFLAERTEGDAMHLRAPVPWQGIELEELPALDAACSCSSSAGLTLEFRCSQLLNGQAGEALLRRMQPSLAGHGAVVNVGEIRVGLPAEAAQALLGQGHRSRSSSGRGAGGVSSPPLLQQQTPSPARPQPRQEQQQQQRAGRASGGGGRVVQDSEDDW